MSAQNHLICVLSRLGHAAQCVGWVLVIIRAVKSAVKRRHQAGSSPGEIVRAGAGVITIRW